MTNEELGMIARRQIAVNEDDFNYSLWCINNGIEMLRRNIWQRGGISLAQKNLESFRALQRDIADLINEIGQTLSIQRAAE